MYHLPPHYRCAAHTLNLIATTYAEEALRDKDLKRISRVVFAKCQGVWNKQSRSDDSATKIREKCNSLFVTPNQTRWISYYDAMYRMKQLLTKSEDNLNSLFDDLGLARIRDLDMVFINEYVEVMEPMARALDILQGEQKAFIGYLLPTIFSLKSKLQRKEHKLIYCCSLVRALLNGIEKRYGHQMGERQLLLASILIPRFKDMAWYDNEQLKNSVQSWLKDEISEQQTMEIEQESASTTSESEDDFFPRMQLHSSLNSDLVKQYLDSPNYQLDCMKAIPVLKKLFRKYNTLLPSSAPVERLFSYGGNILRSRRQNMLDNNFEMTLLLKVNNHLNILDK